jgi:hypothetical protein
MEYISDEIRKIDRMIIDTLNYSKEVAAKIKLLEECFAEQSMQIKDMQTMQESQYRALERCDKMYNHNFSEIERFVKNTSGKFEVLAEVFKTTVDHFHELFKSLIERVEVLEKSNE